MCNGVAEKPEEPEGRTSVRLEKQFTWMNLKWRSSTANHAEYAKGRRVEVGKRRLLVGSLDSGFRVVRVFRGFIGFSRFTVPTRQEVPEETEKSCEHSTAHERPTNGDVSPGTRVKRS